MLKVKERRSKVYVWSNEVMNLVLLPIKIVRKRRYQSLIQSQEILNLVSFLLKASEGRSDADFQSATKLNLPHMPVIGVL